MVNQELKQELLQMKQQDLETRQSLAETGELYEGYNQKMGGLHRRNAERLVQIVDRHGWPGKSLIGEEAAEAAWTIFQHNIAEPEMFRGMLPILKKAADEGEIEKAWLAKTIDRVCMYEGRPQIYGTNYDWDENGELSPWPIQDPEGADKLREEIDLPPLEERTRKIRQEALARGEKAPRDYKLYREQMDQWCHEVGWR